MVWFNFYLILNKMWQILNDNLISLQVASEVGKSEYFNIYIYLLVVIVWCHVLSN